MREEGVETRDHGLIQFDWLFFSLLIMGMNEIMVPVDTVLYPNAFLHTTLRRGNPVTE